MKDTDKFRGIFVALYTAYDEKGEISVERTRALVNYMAEKKVQGLYITGSSGESPYLSVAERKLIMKTIMDENKGRMVIIAHVGAASTKDSIELAAYAKELGCDAISSIPPIYYPLPEDEIKDYWTAMIEASGLPFIIYNIPQNTGTNVSKNLFRRMLENKHTLGMKNTSLPVMDIQQFKSIGGEDCIIFNGPDEQFAAGRLMGADSGIGGTYGVMPELFLKINEFVNNNDFKKASELQRITTSIIIELLSYGGLFAVCKEILRLRGMDIGTPRLPLAQLKPEQVENVKKLNDKINRTIQEWCK